MDLELLEPGDAALVEHIRAAIRTRGPVTFAWFMEQALYHPQHGYYSSGRCTIGRRGDYYTSVSVGPLFGRLLAGQFEEMWRVLARPNEFTILEQGAHDGQLACDVLEATRDNYPDLFAALRYEIVEPFPTLRARQAETLFPFKGQVSWSDGLVQIVPFCGVHFSNELLDAFPVHLVKWTGSEWMERHVAAHEGAFVLIDAPVADAALAARLRAIPTPLPAGYETEVNLAALDWVALVSQKLTTGFVLAADYGFARDQFYAPHRVTGTLRSFAKHRVADSPLAQIGHADITSHVDWTSVGERAETEGLCVVGFADQHHFITGLLAGDAGREFGPTAEAKTRRALQTLLHPNFLGMNFQFLALSKGVDECALAGFQFALDPRAALGRYRASATDSTPASDRPAARPPS